MRILTVCTSRARGGMEMSFVRNSVRLRERGHTVLPVCGPGSAGLASLATEGFAPVVADLWGKFHPRESWRLGSLIASHAIEVVHCDWSRDLFTLVPALARSPHVPLVLQKHVGVLAPKRLWVHYAMYRRVDKVIAISDVIRANFVAMHPIAPAKVTRIHNGIDPVRFRPDAAVRARTRAALGLEPDHVVVGIVGRVTRAKGHLEFLEMAAHLAPRFPEARFLVIGEATRGEEDEGAEILARVEDARLRERVIVTGFRDDVPDLLTALDVFAFPSHAEAFGLALIEAMSAGLPTVSANCDGLLDIVEEGHTGFMVPPRDWEALAAATSTLMCDASLRTRMGQAGRQRVLARFTEERMYGAIEDLYREAISARRR
ncbi:MAG: glycosyltransferase family 4 protein [bacterium]|nr:glycosyltransferase family 4 protein [bacterium]